MSVSRHPIALRLERQVGGATKLLATVMALPLVDGIFPALVIAGALTVPFGILETGLLIFGGSATVAVILAELEGGRREHVGAILLLGAVLVPVAVLEAALAETLRTVLAFETFHRFAGLVILAVAAKTASAEVGEYLPSPGVIVGLGLLASFQPAGFELVLTPDPLLMAKAAAAAGTGVAFALAVALLGPRLRGSVDLDLFRFGSAVALGMLALNVLGLMPTDAPVALGVLCVTAVFAYDPTDEPSADATPEADGEPPTEDPGTADEPAPASASPAAEPGTMADGGDDDGEASYGYPDEDGDRAPWL